MHYLKTKLLLFLCLLILSGCLVKNADEAVHLEHLVLFESDSLYVAWPAVARTGDGEILVLFCSTDEHMGPDGKIVGVRSGDEGKSWTEPFEVYDTPLDERESGLTLLSDGSLIAHIWSTKHTPESYGRMAPGSYYDEIVARWIDQVSQPEYVNAAEFAGGHVTITRDGGRSWNEPVEGPDTIHGGIELKDGTLLVAAYRLTRKYVTIHKAESWDGPWQQVAEVHSPQPDSLRFGEPSVLQLPSGRIIMMMRTTSIPYNDSDPRCYLWKVTAMMVV